MPIFAYRASDPLGRSTEGVVTADTAAAGRHALRKQGLRPLDFRKAEAHRHGTWWTKWGGRRRRREQVAEVARQLAMLLRAGVPLVEALGVVIAQCRTGIGPVLREVRDRVSAGARFSEAIEVHRPWFDPVFCSAVRVGERTGSLEQCLTDLAEFIRERQTVSSRVASALAYPAILAVLGTGVVLFLMSFVVPQLLAVLEASGRELPTATLLLKRGSDFLVAYWAFLLLGALTAKVSFLALVRRPAWRRRWHLMQLRAPVVGGLLQKLLVAQFAQSMALLLRSGIGFVEALHVVRGGTRNLVLAGELEAMSDAIRRGSDIAPALKASRVFPPLVARVMAVGQDAGELPAMLNELREGYASEVRLAVGKATAVLEPLLIVVLSAAVGFVVFATMMPILEATKAMQS